MSILNKLKNMFKRVEHDHVCRCGGLENQHTTGVRGCLRIMVIPPEDLGNGYWLVDGHKITGFMLLDQRGYHMHSCECWSRHEGSDNSISA